MTDFIFLDNTRTGRERRSRIQQFSCLFSQSKFPYIFEGKNFMRESLYARQMCTVFNAIGCPNTISIYHALIAYE